MSFRPATLSPNPEVKRTNDLVYLFSTTLHSLAADATAVRQTTSLSHCLIGVDSSNDDCKKRFDQGLRDLEELVSGMEEKVVALRQIVSEEKRSIAKFESTLQQEADEQASLMIQMVQALEEHEHQNLPRGNSANLPRFEDENEQDRSTTPHSSAERASRGNDHRRDSMDPRRHRRRSSHGSELENKDPITSMISLPRITKEELEDYKSKNVQSPRISLIDLNEALEEIEELCQRHRHAALLIKRKQQHQQQQLQHGTPLISPGALQRRHDYLQRRQATNTSSSMPASNNCSSTTTTSSHSTPLDETEDTIVSITEQDLRENCAFFRHGESTARATLSVLCRLKRLKQVPNKNREVTYHLVTY